MACHCCVVCIAIKLSRPLRPARAHTYAALCRHRPVWSTRFPRKTLFAYAATTRRDCRVCAHDLDLLSFFVSMCRRKVTDFAPSMEDLPTVLGVCRRCIARTAQACPMRRTHRSFEFTYRESLDNLSQDCLNPARSVIIALKAQQTRVMLEKMQGAGFHVAEECDQ